jgi:hypothetical protein
VFEADYVHEISDSRSPAEATIEAVAKAEEADETDLDFLVETVDPDALDRIVTESGGRVEFDYEGYTVVVSEERVQLIE